MQRELVVGILLVALSLVLACNLIGSTQSVRNDLPSDNVLAKAFAKDEKKLRTLVSMSDEDSHVVRIAHDFTLLEDDMSFPRKDPYPGFSEERWETYRELFKQADLKNGLIRNPDSGDISFPKAMQGSVTGGAEKGFVFSRHEPSPQVESLDRLDPMPSSGKRVYKKLKQEWYAYVKLE